MTLRELVDAIATDPNSSILFDVEDRLAPPDAIIGYCSSLVRLTGQTVDYKQVGSASASALPYASSIEPAPASEARSELHLKAGSDAESETEYGYEPQLELAHFSVKEYLLLHRNETPYQEYFQIPAANATIASTCLAYLWTLQKPHLTKLMDATHGMEKHEIRTKFPLTDFATRHWLDHARLAGENQEKLFFWTSKIFVDKPFMEFWLQFYNPALGMGQRLSYAKATAPALYYASLGGLDRSIRLLLDRGAYIDAGSESGRSALQIAAHEGNVELVEILIRRGADINARNQYFLGPNSGSHMTALTAASNNGHVRTVQVLLEHGSDINAGFSTMVCPVNFSGTALRAASANGHLGVVQLLLGHGADVNIDRHGFALHAALSGAYTEVSLLLLKRGADTCAYDDNYGTALHAAVLGDDLTIVKLLLERGAHNTEWGLHGAVEAAVMNDRYDMLETLLLHFSERDRENDVLNAALGYTGLDTDGRIIRILLEMGADNIHRKNKLLAEACHRGYVAKVKLLLDFGAKFDRHFNCLTGTNKRRFNPLRHFYVASQGAQFEIAKLLVARDAKSNSSDLYNATALKYACAIGRHEIVEYLLESGADVPKPCDYLSLPLDIACRSGALEVIEVLLKHGADVKACDSDALMFASRRGHIGIAQLLLAQGADVNGSRTSEAPIQAACYDENLELVELLLLNGADLNAARGNSGSALSNACLSGNTALVSLLLDRGVHPDALDERGCSALQRVCVCALGIDLNIVQLLLDRGADVNTRGGYLGTALYEATSKNEPEVVQILLERGADPNLRDKRFGSALQAACSRWCEHSDLVQLLLDNGADVDVGGGTYGNALCAAVYNRHVESAHMLLDRGAHIEMRGGEHGNALQIAIKRGLDDIRKRLLKRGWRIVIRKRPFWRRRCALSNWHPSIQRDNSLRPVYSGRTNRYSSSDVSSDGSWSSASSGTTRTSSLDGRYHIHEPYSTCTSSIRSSSGS
jgi:ankyrin repeat protein